MKHRAYRYAIGVALFALSSGFALPATASAASQIQGRMAARVGGVVLPAHISIASSAVDADIIPVGVTATGNLDVPHNFVQAGWYQFGALPGQPGNAVIDAHVDNGSRVPGPFKHLTSAKPGDDIAIAMTDGSVAHYTVVDASIYPTTAFPSRSVFVGDGATPVLKLITCNGTFVRSTGTYDHRLIVTAIASQKPVATTPARPSSPLASSGAPSFMARAI